jgi:hypothetical protein
MASELIVDTVLASQGFGVPNSETSPALATPGELKIINGEMKYFTESFGWVKFGDPKNVDTDGLLLNFDLSSKNCVSGIGCAAHAGARPLLKNLINPSDSFSSTSNIKVSGLDYYTVFAIDYPEGNYGGAAAGRDGITPGFNVTSGSKLTDADYTRALHMHVWDPETGWLPNTYFRGLRANGHCYDTWTGYTDHPAEGVLFEEDFANVKSLFPFATFVIAGSHRDSYHWDNKFKILKSLGAPASVTTDLDGAPEWILVGKPGLGTGNYYGWAFENWSENSAQVAHLVFGLPPFGDRYNSLDMPGSGQYITLTNADYWQNIEAISYELWFQTNTANLRQGLISTHAETGGSNQDAVEIEIQADNTSFVGFRNVNGTFYNATYNTTLSTNTWYHLVGTVDETGVKYYLNGELVAQNTSWPGGAVANSPANQLMIGRYASHYLNGKIGDFRIYSYAVTQDTVKQNYRSTAFRFN